MINSFLIKIIFYIQLSSLLLSLGLLGGRSEAVVDVFPGLSKIFKINNQDNDGSSAKSTFSHSLGPISVNLNMYDPQQYQNGNVEVYYHYVPPPPPATNFVQPNTYGQYYGPVPPLGYYPPPQFPQQYPAQHPQPNSLPMPPLAPFKNANLIQPDQPLDKGKLKGIITPDSPFYVKIPEEPTMYGIEPRR
ncbi:hypothetical protein FF38_07873 [Lucilia cuprina]|uniref:DUF4794 domain-containing protein n=1 Tax=Lucilia cuprina TaxID=7375 RepID=A0A0L0C0B7_LUCCU|nr:hypothetical protein FF38_07873 [Lucilia cuprina]